MLKRIGWIILVWMLLNSSALAQSIQFSKQRIVDVPTENVDGCTLVDLNTVAEMTNLNVTWNEANQSIKLMDMGNVLTLYLGKKEGNFNGQTIGLGTAPTLSEGVTYVPLRPVVEQFGYKLTQANGQLIISRSLSKEDEQTIENWNTCCNYGHYGLLTCFFNEGEGRLPLKEAKESIAAQVKVINTDINSPNANQLVKVLGRECISTLEKLPDLYDMALKGEKENFDRAYYLFINKFQFIESECHYIENGEFSDKYIERKGMEVAPYDEVKVSTGYDYAMNRLKNECRDIEQRFISKEIYMQELFYRISSTSEVREQLKDIRSKIRSQEADQVIDVYLAYADAMLDYYCEMRKNLYSPKNINTKYQKALKDAESTMETTYNEYISFGK